MDSGDQVGVEGRGDQSLEQAKITDRGWYQNASFKLSPKFGCRLRVFCGMLYVSNIFEWNSKLVFGLMIYFSRKSVHNFFLRSPKQVDWGG